MSATFDTKLFVNYFKQALPRIPGKNHSDSDKSPFVPELFVGVKRYPVDIVYLDTLLENKLLANQKSIRPTDILNICSKFGTKSYKPDALNNVVSKLIHILAIHHKNDVDGNAILIFLPGISSIENLEELLVDKIIKLEGEETDEKLLPVIEISILHSLVDDQTSVFEPISSGTTRVILATNIAESSVTLPMVRYVLDFGLTRQLEYDHVSMHTTLSTTWISRASAKQRSGRCGRLFPGTAFRLYPQSFYENQMSEYDIPEMQRISITTTILMLKMKSENVDKDSPFHNPRECLRKAIQPPANASIDSAVIELLNNDVLRRSSSNPDEPSSSDLNDFVELELRQSLRLSSSCPASDTMDNNDNIDHPHEESNGHSSNGDALNMDEPFDSLKFCTITHLGRFLATLPFDLRIGRLVAIGARCGRYILHTLLLAVALTSGELFLRPMAVPDDTFSIGVRMSLENQTGRNKVSSCLSDLLCVIRQYIDFKYTKKNNSAIHHQRMKKFISAVSEIARKLETVLPNHIQWLRVFRRNEKVSLQELTSVLSYEKEDFDFLRFIIAIAFKQDGILTPQIKTKSFRVASFSDQIQKEDWDRVAIFSVPEEYGSLDSLKTILPDIAKLCTKSFSSDSSLALLFPREKIPNFPFSIAPLGIRVLGMLTRKRNDILIPSAKEEGATVRFKGFKCSPTIQWKFNNTSCINTKHSLYSHLLPDTENSNSNFIALPGNIQYFNSSPTPSISQITVIPSDSPLIPIICLVIHNGQIIVSEQTPASEQEQDQPSSSLPSSEQLNSRLVCSGARIPAPLSTIEVSFDVKPSLEFLNSPEFQQFTLAVNNLLLTNIDDTPSKLNEKVLSSVLKRLQTSSQSTK